MNHQISIFKRKTMSGYIRGEQIAPYIPAKLSPQDGYEDDVCIFVKWTPAIKKWWKVYIDVIDKHQCLKYLKRNPECGAVAISRTAVDFIKEELGGRNEVAYIPQQHCNIERLKRDKSREVKVVGFCGEFHTFQPFEDEIRRKLKGIGMEFDFYHSYRSRQDIVNFYKRIDVQIVWRLEPGYIKMLKNPLKLSNAGSFGIPTVAYPEQNFVAEYGDTFMQVKSIDEMVMGIEAMKRNPTLYSQYSLAVERKAEEYYITNISKLYQQLGEE